MSYLSVREQIIDSLRREIIGPDPVSPVQANGEEILTIDPPRLRYGAGVLFPRATTVETAVDVVPDEMPIEVGSETEVAETVSEASDGPVRAPSAEGDEDEAVALANAYLPCALGLSCLAAIPGAGLDLCVRAATYTPHTVPYVTQSGETKQTRQYWREPFSAVLLVPPADLIGAGVRRWHQSVRLPSGAASGLRAHIISRPSRHGDCRLITVSLVNDLSSPSGRTENEKCFFQVELEVRGGDGSACFREYPERVGCAIDDEDASMDLLYRQRKTFAIGHGCAADWHEHGNDAADKICSQSLPCYETKPIVPQLFPDLVLRMGDLSDAGDQKAIVDLLTALCDRYAQWIDVQESTTRAAAFPERHRSAAQRHLNACRRCLDRMRRGVALLANDARAMRAFQLANRVMLQQQLHYALPRREWRSRGDGSPELPAVSWPDLHDPPAGKGAWYPFQIAFILLNLASLSRPDDDERQLVDLIWFPTGGGKTEAYLGLTAYTILYRRLSDPGNSGTTVLMRYTLRLLTAQQFERAGTLICALELLRRNAPGTFGDTPITIGLWVGNDVTPGKRTNALTALRKLAEGTDRDNPFVLLRCPWCGAQMGVVALGSQARVMGYERTGRPETVAFRCRDAGCPFSGPMRLPVLVIDEDIYAAPPTLLIGTVDKFATLPWQPEARKLFGIDAGNTAPPDLIIQDELHLISGPLGSMVGHYETPIQQLCQRNLGTKSVGAKIVASTATISRAAEQCHGLYNCGTDRVFLFPPQCLQAGESFFAFEDRQAPGRLYVGVHASALPSHVTAQVRVLSALLQGPLSATVDEECERDPYWTLIGYFNSLRELGHAATLIRADIREYLNATWLRKGIRRPLDDAPDRRRFINVDLELTSRIPSTRIPASLQRLWRTYADGSEEKPVDVCLATNMISVGVDVPRLGLMSVIGQPKTTSEYIQATSRVGRRYPGLVVTIYNPAKPRDRSHFEHFRSYHAALYRHVEPTSVTSFAAPVRERALHALLVTLVRYLGSPTDRDRPQPFPTASLLDAVQHVIAERVQRVDPEEAAGTLALLSERLDHWRRVLPARYGGFGPPTQDLPLMYPAGSEPSIHWEGKSWPTPSSMREVDAGCEAVVIARYAATDEGIVQS